VILLAASAVSAVTYTITVQTDASSYSGAQTVRVSGTVSPAPGPGTAAFLKVLNPNNSPVAVGGPSVDGTSGAYQYSFVTGGSSNWIVGTYVINATWGSSGPVVFSTARFNYSPSVTTTTTSSQTSTTSTPSTVTSTVTVTSTSTSISTATVTTATTTTSVSTQISTVTSTTTSTTTTSALVLSSDQVTVGGAVLVALILALGGIALVRRR